MSLKCPNCDDGYLLNSDNSIRFVCDSCETKVVHQGNAFVLE